jgi:hypothetical protein
VLSVSETVVVFYATRQRVRDQERLDFVYARVSSAGHHGKRIDWCRVGPVDLASIPRWRHLPDAAQILARDRSFFIAPSCRARRVRARKAARRLPLARLRIPPWLSSASQSGRSALRRPKLPVRRRALLFRRTGLFAWPLEWRQLRAVLDPHAYRTDVELWINLCAISASAQWPVDR